MRNDKSNGTTVCATGVILLAFAACIFLGFLTGVLFSSPYLVFYYVDEYATTHIPPTFDSGTFTISFTGSVGLWNPSTIPTAVVRAEYTVTYEPLADHRSSYAPSRSVVSNPDELVFTFPPERLQYLPPVNKTATTVPVPGPHDIILSTVDVYPSYTICDTTDLTSCDVPQSTPIPIPGFCQLPVWPEVHIGSLVTKDQLRTIAEEFDRRQEGACPLNDGIPVSSESSRFVRSPITVPSEDQFVEFQPVDDNIRISGREVYYVSVSVDTVVGTNSLLEEYIDQDCRTTGNLLIAVEFKNLKFASALGRSLEPVEDLAGQYTTIVVPCAT